MKFLKSDMELSPKLGLKDTLELIAKEKPLNAVDVKLQKLSTFSQSKLIKPHHSKSRSDQGNYFEK